MTVALDLVAEARNAYQRLRVGRTPNQCFVLRPDATTLKIELEADYPEGKSLGEIANDLPGNDTRLIVVMPERKHADGRKSYPIVLIAYCPQGLSPQVNIVHSNARTMVAKDFQLTLVWDVKKRLLLSDEALAEKLESNKW
jgi:hypothetical protein